MCGIAGVVMLRGGEASAEIARTMAERQRHRGPDKRSAYVSPDHRCALGHSRLRIIDLETGDQPMTNEDRSVWVVFNGEIYNFPVLRADLEAAGHCFRTRSDTETIVHGYEEWGERLTERLDGMFAFAVWDDSRKRLLLARDRAGKKPLFIYRDDQKLVFASETKALLDCPGIDAGIDPCAVPLYLVHGYVPTPGTFYRNIRKLPPASCLTIEPDGSEKQWRYWDLRFQPKRTSVADAAEELRTALGAAVARRMIADVSLGAFLSGGIDSTIVVGLMSSLAGKGVRTFSIGYADDPVYDETGYARIAAGRFGTDHREFLVEPQSIDLVDRLVDAYDEPFGDSSAIPTFIVSELARRHVTVALCGDGGDELFAGYWRFYGAVIAERLPRFVVQLGDAIGRRLPHRPSHRDPLRRFARFFNAAALPLEERMLRWIGFFPADVGEILRPDLAAQVERSGLTRSFRDLLNHGSEASPLAKVLQLNFRTYLLDDLLEKADRCSMAHGLELRSPFLDTRVMELAASFPDRLKLRNGETKFILKRAFRDLLPREIRSRGKMGFGMPIPTWFRGEWRPAVEERLLTSHAKIYDWLRPEPVRRMAEEHFAGSMDYGHRLWALLTLETWLERRQAA